MARALRLHQANSLGEADALYREVLRIAPGHLVALHLAGLVAHQRGRHAEAVELIELALAGGANSAAIFNNLGSAYRALGNLQMATQQFAQALALDPEFADAHFNFAMSAQDQGLLEQAKMHFGFALELQPDSPKVNFCLGQILLYEGRFALAAEKFRLDMRVRPDYAESHHQLGRALYHLGDVPGALRSLNAALELQPSHGPASYLAAKMSFELCRTAEALARLDHAHRSMPALYGAGMRAVAARLGRVDLWCGDDYTRLARPQWLSLPPLKTLPEDEAQAFHMLTPFALEIFLARIRGARVLPHDLLLLSTDGHLFLDGFVRNSPQYASREDRGIRHCADDGRLLLSVPERTVHVDEPCVWLGAADNHFQWIWECLARLWAVRQQPGLEQLPLVVQPQLTRWQDELLRLLGYAKERRLEAPHDAILECGELHAASLVTAMHFISPVAIQYLRRELAAAVAAPKGPVRRIYLSRRGLATRRLANEAELLPLLEQRGFVVLDPETLSAAEQLTLFQSAEVILGVDGAALTNLFIAPAHARVGVIVARGLNEPRHYYVSAPLGQDLRYIIAEPDYASNPALAECNVSLGRDRLEAFLAGL